MGKKLTLLSTSMLVSILAFSQQDTLHGNDLDPVIVTANKTEQKQSTTGKVISVISKEQIEKSAGKTVAELLNEQAGITINGALNNAGSVQTLYMRGAASGRALILVDGIPVNDPSMINNEFDLNLFSINDVERIEICKGAQSTLYGSDAIAGVINIITIKNNISAPFNFKSTITGGNLGTFKGNFQLYGKEDKFSYTARYSKLVSNGFSAAYDSTGSKNFDKDGYNGDAASVALQYQSTKKLLFKAFSQYSQYTAGLDAGPFADATNYDAHNKSWISGTGFQYKNEKLSFVGNYQYSKIQRNYNDNASIPNPSSFQLLDYSSIAQFAELYANIKLHQYFSLLVGTDLRYSSMNSQYNSLSSWGPYKSVFNDTGMSQNSFYTSLFLNYKNLNVEAGLRYNHHSRYGSNSTFTFNPSYKINDQFRIFGSIASGFKAPSIYQLYDTYSGNKNLQPETSVNYEVGVQQQLKKFSQRLVFFYRNINNGIDYNYISYQYFNYTLQKVNGLEYEVTARPTKKLNITANYSLLLSKETTESRITFNDTTYNYSLRRPKNTINITAAYQFTPAFYASIGGKYVSKRYDVGGYTQADVLLNDYFLLNAYAEYQVKKNIKLFADAQNITNKKFFDVRGYNSIPFLINAGVTVHL
ncbi:MAG: TonB-dependent receptor [Bacteroidota bacterium]|nr:TonB-dependent receptor [Bacteroidota bacterium]